MDETFPQSTWEINSAYDASKAQGEEVVQNFIKKGLEATIVNPTGVIGPYDYTPSRMGQFFLDIYNGRFPALIQGGFDWVDVRDVIQAIIQAEKKGRCGEKYILSGQYASTKELAVMANKWTDLKVPFFCSPLWMAKCGIPFAKILSLINGKEPLVTKESIEALSLDKKISNKKAQNELGFIPRELTISIRDTYAWFLREGFLKPNPRTEELLVDV